MSVSYACLYHYFSNPVCGSHNSNVVVIVAFVFIDYTVIMVALSNRADHYIFTLWFLLSFFLLSFFNFPRLISAVGDWMPAILPHMVWPQCKFRMQD